MKVALAALMLVLLATAASAQYTFDAKGRRYKCLPGDWSCTVLPPPGAPLQPLPLRDNGRRPLPPPVDQCGTRCDLLDRMK
jgi:hypothetical protein